MREESEARNWDWGSWSSAGAGTGMGEEMTSWIVM